LRSGAGGPRDDPIVSHDELYGVGRDDPFRSGRWAA
jgi:hypothetical protein